MRIPSKLPDQVTAGLSFEATVYFPDYLAPAWSLHAVIRGPMSIDLDAVADGLSHKFSVDAATTANWLPGRYWYGLRASDGTQTLAATDNELVVLPDLATVGPGYDGRTESEIALDAIDAVLGKKATRDQMRYKINNRELFRMPMAELMKLRSFYVIQVRRERQKRAGNPTNPFGRQIIVRFKG